MKVTGRPQVRNSAELRRFPSSHPSLFSGFFWIFWGQMRGGNEGEALYKRPDPPVARRRGDRPPWRAHWPVAPGVGDRGLSPVGGATGPPLFFSPGTSLQIWRKKLHLSPVAPHRATGVYFWNFPKPTYIFEILIFFKYKKEKTARWMPHAACMHASHATVRGMRQVLAWINGSENKHWKAINLSTESCSISLGKVYT